MNKTQTPYEILTSAATFYERLAVGPADQLGVGFTPTPSDVANRRTRFGLTAETFRAMAIGVVTRPSDIAVIARQAREFCTATGSLLDEIVESTVGRHAAAGVLTTSEANRHA